MSKDASWKGRLQKRWRWSTFSFEWGRWCYVTDYTGETLDSWWEWENK